MNNINAIREAAELLMRDGMREMYLAVAGIKAAPALADVFARHQHVTGHESLMTVQRAFTVAASGDDHRRARLLLNWLVTTIGMQATAALIERTMQWESRTTIALPDGTTAPYFEIPRRLQRAASAEEREAIMRAREHVVHQELSPLALERFAVERAFVTDLGLADGYVRSWELLNEIDLSVLLAQCETFLCATDALWRRTLDTLAARIGARVDRLTRADAHALFSGDRFDAFFPGSDTTRIVSSQLTAMGIDPTGNGRIILDLADREGKDPRAACVAVRVPDEVYLSVKPVGGHTQWSHFLHEMGHALHFANTSAELPIEYRRFGDTSVTETYAFLFDHLLQDTHWLAAHTQLDSQAHGFVWEHAANELYTLRRYCAKLDFEMLLYSGECARAELEQRYADGLTRATGLQHTGHEALVDVDAGLYVAHYMRARQLSAVLASHLVDRFGHRWWESSRCGHWLVNDLFVHGSSIAAAELSQTLGAGPLSFMAIGSRLEQILSA